jgi:hypothetical protein
MSTGDTLATMLAREQERMAAVPTELVESLGERMYDDAHEGCDEGGCTGGGKPFYEEYARVLLAGLAEDAWIVPKIPHDETVSVGPRILRSGLIRREAGTSDADHTRQYAAQLLAAADTTPTPKEN